MKIKRRKTVAHQMSGRFNAVFQRRDHCWIAWIEELPGANTQGKTLQEARSNLQEAARLILQTNRELAEKHADGLIRHEPIRVIG